MKRQNLIFYSLLVLLIFLSLFPRSIEILNQNPVFGFDQGRDYLAVKNIVVNHKPTLIGEELGAGAAGISGIFQGPFYYYVLAIPFILFNGNPVGGVYVMFILSILTIVAGFYLGNRLFGKWGGLLSALLISISPILTGEARFIWNPHCPPFFIILTLIFLYFSIKQQKGLDVFLTAFFAGFIYNFEIAVSLPICLTLIILSPFLFRKNLKLYLYLIFGFMLAFSPAVLFEVRHHFLAINNLISYLGNHSQYGSIPYSFYVVNHLRGFIDNFKESFLALNFNLALIFFIAIVLTATWLAIKEKDKNLQKLVIFMLLLIPVDYCAFYFLKNWLWTYYLTNLTVVYMFLIPYILCCLYKSKYLKATAVLLVLITVLVTLGFINSIKTSLHDYSDYGGVAKLKGKEDAIDYIYKQAKGKPFGLFVFSPPIYTYGYDYLIWWYGQRKYGYLPYQEKKGQVFLLIEKDNDKPWTYKGWLETVIKSGTIVNTVTLPNGFIVQERTF